MKLYLTPKTLKKIIKMLVLFILACILIYFSNTLSVNAYTISNNSLYVCDSSDNVLTGRYNYILDGSNYVGYFGTTYQGVMTSFSTRFNAIIQQGNSYTLELNSYTGDFRNITANSIQVLGGIGTHCSNNLNSYTITSVSSTYYKIIINFIANSTNNYSQLVIYNNDNSDISGITNFKIDSITLVDNGNSGTNTIIDNQNQNKQDIIDNQNQNANSIIDNQNQTTQDIIDNQNQNNEELKDTLDSSLNNCRESYNLFNPSGGNLINGKGISSDGSIINDTTGSYYDYFIPVNSSTTYNLSNKDNVIFAGSWFFAYYDNNKNFISLNKLGENSTNFTFTTSSNVSYIRLYSYLNLANVNSLNNIMLSKGSSKISFENYGQVCTSKLDDTNSKLDNLNSNITDSSDPNLAIGDVAGWLPPGPVDSVLNLPLTILNSLISNLSNRTCSSVNVPLPYIDKSIQLPCLSTIFDKTGFTDVLNTISIPFAIFIYINTLIKLYGWVDKTLQFREEHWNDVDQWGGV